MGIVCDSIEFAKSLRAFSEKMMEGLVNGKLFSAPDEDMLKEIKSQRF
jgi:hypothetical protein